MELVYFTEQTLPRNTFRQSAITPKISFGKGGVIAFNKKACELLALKPGDRISIAQNKKEPFEWYVFKDASNGFPIRDKDFEKNGTTAFNHKELRTSFLDSLSLDVEVTYSFALDGTGTKVGGGVIPYFLK